ncbi:SGNH/GDSL hydrolase family protein [Streptomyces olivochromogenes]|uniref:Lipase n=1 Tax=Streptomyces olivochromogenes TaxID=1963 RepID=A0A250VKH7_STROL|nr:SGNH/GDSL hydrolase family protein [Streptomyces olivochromogenes]KUN42845.1 GDSL family lipase [Streptomyces olivochromogenes]GAX54586.1 lipase [Streptomyces olivochromogenes]
MTNHLRTVLIGVFLACATLVAAVGISRHTSGTDPAGVATPRGPYVALGDSYTAGPRIPDRTGSPAGCDRSDHDYPALVAERLGLRAADFRDVSCSGATVADLTTPQSTDDGTNPAQLSALSAGTRLVTLGIGGNDIGFASLVTTCVKAGVFYDMTGRGKYTGDDAPCRGKYVSGDTDDVQRKIDTAGERLSEALAEVKRRAPKAHVYVVGYPAILPAHGSGCADDLTLAPGDATYLHDKEQQLNAVLRERAQDAGAGYVDTYKPSVGRDACSGRDTRWIEPLLPGLPAAPMHPNERGARGMADAVLRAVGAPR